MCDFIFFSLFIYFLVFFFFFFFFNDPATTEIYTLSLHDALPISDSRSSTAVVAMVRSVARVRATSRATERTDRKSTRLNSSHPSISYAVFCLKKKKKKNKKIKMTKKNNNIHTKLTKMKTINR